MNVNDVATTQDLVWDPLVWAADCRAQARSVSEPQARAAFIQLAEEFEVAATEIAGLIATVEALGRHKKAAWYRPN